MFHRVPESHKPLVLWVAGMLPGVHGTIEWLEEHHIPVFPSPEKAIRGSWRSCTD
jgi:acyl-CoA synthetase (NDP forming)